MIRRSGVSPARLASNTARETPRRSASGQSAARQPRKLAAAARIACAVIRGWLEAPDSPLQSGADASGAGAVGAAGALNSARISGSWAKSGVGRATTATSATALKRYVDRASVRSSLAMMLGLGDGSCASGNGEPRWLQDR